VLSSPFKSAKKGKIWSQQRDIKSRKFMGEGGRLGGENLDSTSGEARKETKVLCKMILKSRGFAKKAWISRRIQKMGQLGERGGGGGGGADKSKCHSVE